MTQTEIRERLQAVITDKFACDAEDATLRQMYESVVAMVVKELSRRRKAGHKKSVRAGSQEGLLYVDGVSHRPLLEK